MTFPSKSDGAVYYLNKTLYSPLHSFSNFFIRNVANVEDYILTSEDIKELEELDAKAREVREQQQQVISKHLYKIQVLRQ